MDDWINISYTHTVVCEKCGNLFTIVQKDNPLKEEILQYLLQKMHLQETLQSLMTFIEEFDTFVDVDIEDNRECVPKHSEHVSEAKAKLYTK
jgi:hypothetical protein